MASSPPWPFDDEDRPSGSVRPLSQADLQAILAHLADDPDELLARTGADQPVVAVRVRASVGRPGGSAQVQWRRTRAVEWAAWTRNPALAGRRPPRDRCRRRSAWQPPGCPAGTGHCRADRCCGRLGATVPTQPRRGRLAARGGGGAAHRPAARPLERHGWAILHDLALPASRANIDHLVIGAASSSMGLGGCGMAATR